MAEEIELLRRFVAEGSQVDFTELVRRRVNFVYATALRVVGGDSHLAEDVTQGVFLALGKEAAALTDRTTLTGWLYTATRMLAAKAVRSHRRWKDREQEANAMANTMNDSENLRWSELKPVIDDVMGEIPETDREALLLHFFDGEAFASVGSRLGLGENTARMRVERALEKLRARLSRRGITCTAAAVAKALASQTFAVAPVGLAASAAAGALTATVAGSVVQGLGGFSGLVLSLMNKSKLILGTAAIVALGSLGGYSLLKDRYAAQERRLTSEMAVLRVENLKVRRDIRQLSRFAVLTPGTLPSEDPRGRLQEAEKLLASDYMGSSLGKVSWPEPYRNSLQAGMENFAKFAGLTAGETEALEEIGAAGLAEFEAAVVAHAAVKRDGNRLEISLKDEPAVHEAYERMLHNVATLLGPDLYRYYESLGARAANEKLFGKWGLGGINYNIVSSPPPGGASGDREYLVELPTTPTPPEIIAARPIGFVPRRPSAGFRGRENIRLNFGPIESLIPADL
jgi:RNA polymerase sigma factor (sigma-70 family)